MEQTENNVRPYEPPRLRAVGSVHELTLDLIDKRLGPTDGLTFQGDGLANASP
jgi:hypothetical protein